MKIGEQVEVTWIGQGEPIAPGMVFLASEDGASIAVLFPDCPPFAFVDASASMTAHGYLLLLREKPDGSWEDAGGTRNFQVRRFASVASAPLQDVA